MVPASASANPLEHRRSPLRADGAPRPHVRRAGPEHEPPAAAEVALDERLEPRRRAAQQVQHGPEREEVGVLGVGERVARARRRAEQLLIAGLL